MAEQRGVVVALGGGESLEGPYYLVRACGGRPSSSPRFLALIQSSKAYLRTAQLLLGLSPAPER